MAKKHYTERNFNVQYVVISTKAIQLLNSAHYASNLQASSKNW